MGNPKPSLFVSNVEHSCTLQSQRPRSWARKEEIWTRQTPWAPSQIHAHGSNQWKRWKVWRRDTGIFLEMEGKKQHMECKLLTKRIRGISASWVCALDLHIRNSWFLAGVLCQESTLLPFYKTCKITWISAASSTPKHLAVRWVIAAVSQPHRSNLHSKTVMGIEVPICPFWNVRSACS